MGLVSPPLAPWESATGVAQESRPGLLGTRRSGALTLLVWGALAVLLFPVLGWQALPVGLVLARLVALDLTTYTLPNVYTLPMLLVGWVYAFQHGLAGQALLAASLLAGVGVLLGGLTSRMGLGGGDFKLLASLFAFLPVFQGVCAVGLGCLLWLPVAFWAPRRPVPFGVPVVLGWVLVLRWPHLPNWLFSTIS